MGLHGIARLAGFRMLPGQKSIRFVYLIENYLIYRVNKNETKL